MESAREGRGYARNLAAMEEHLEGCYYESDEHYAHGQLNAHENEHSESESSADESPIGTQFNYSPVEVIHGPRGVQGSQFMRSSQPASSLRGRVGAAGRGTFARGRRYIAGGVNLFSNPLPLEVPNVSTHFPARRHRGINMHASQSSQDQLCEGITTTDPPIDPSTARTVLGDIGNMHDIGRSPSHRLPRGSRRRVVRKTGLWSDQQLKEAMDAIDNGLSMKKAANKFHVPYSTLREWCYSVRTSRKRGPPAVLSPCIVIRQTRYGIAMRAVRKRGGMAEG